MQEDSLEHYAFCPVCVRYLRCRLCYSEPIDRGHLLVLGLHENEAQLGLLQCLAIWNYILYSSHNHLRCLSAEAHNAVEVTGVMEQYYREVVKDCSQGMMPQDDG